MAMATTRVRQTERGSGSAESARDRAGRRGRFGMALTWGVLVGGVAVSVVAGSFWYGTVQRQYRQTFVERTSTVSATLATAVRRDMDFVAVQSGIFASFSNLSNRQLGRWYRSIDMAKRYPGSVGFGFVEVVPAAQLASFGAEVLADPPIGNPVSAPYTVLPSGVRASYCLERFNFNTSAAASAIAPANFDFCSPILPTIGPSPIPALLRQASATGLPTVLMMGASAPVKLRDVFAVWEPVYAGGVTPTSAAARDQALVGWAGGSFSAPAVVGSSLGSQTDLGVALLRPSASGKSILVASGGVVASKATVSRTVSFEAGGRWTIRIVGVPTGNAWQQAAVVAGLGSLISLLLFLVVGLLSRSRSRAMHMVNRRTGELRHQALHDALTDLPNRALILDRAEQMLRRARRQPLAVAALFIDLDNFKDINDSFGHQAGDRLLQSVAARLTTTLREGDTVGRIGGDEFVVLVEGASLDAGPELVAERLLAVLTEPFEIDTQPPVSLTVRASIGIAVGQRDTADELLRDADVALYQAKAAGKDRFVVFLPEMQVAVQDRLGLEIDLREAVNLNQLFVVYQPIFNLDEMTTTGVEALLRWQHPTRGVVMPDDFILLAEETGLIVPIGRFVLDQACNQAAAWTHAGYWIGVSVNVSGRQLDNDHIVNDVQLALAHSRLDPGLLTLEITETGLMHNAEQTAARLRSLKDLGVRIAIDDFGTGYSSLAYLRQFPVDALKIDRSFITQIASSTESGALIHTLVQLGKALDIETLAEGIEEDAQLITLQREHCDSGQGFLYSRPLAADAVQTFFQKDRTVPPPHFLATVSDT